MASKTPNPAPAILGIEVIEKIAAIAGVDPALIRENDHLRTDLLLTLLQLKALAEPFTLIARDHGPDNVTVTRSACAKLTNVGSALSLVSKAAGFDGSIEKGVLI